MRPSNFIFTLTCVFVSHLAIGQCNPFFDYGEGTVIEKTYFNKKGKETSRDKMEILSVTGDQAKQTSRARVTLYDKKKEISSNEIELICENGVFKMDMRSFVPEGMDQMEGVDIVFEGDQLTIPADLSPGQSLKDMNFTVKIVSDNPAMAAVATNTDVSITNRKVVGEEKITTAAGSYDCYKITYDSQTSMSIMGMKRTMKTTNVDWISEDVGIVKSETYDEKGKLGGYIELSSFSK